MSSTMKESAFQSEPRVSESLVRHTSTSPADKAKVTISDGKGADEEKPKKSSLCRTVEGCREELQNQVGSEGARHRGRRAGPAGGSSADSAQAARAAPLWAWEPFPFLWVYSFLQREREGGCGQLCLTGRAYRWGV